MSPHVPLTGRNAEPKDLPTQQVFEYKVPQPDRIIEEVAAARDCYTET